ncbi:zinc fingers and homeoboxes protein 1-like isoform X2 [Plectropomus leopardus]|uniref:zinc fingers and homeoboxes protein 1-like isoform X2 n=1 Tax=Plectropomus leopardus TaxID=160734 RepID=UPI001C4D5EE7|nr:zinc fingers and homeoboxes protein 1-like isoform X2 [Plectropomus leopardus]
MSSRRKSTTPCMVLPSDVVEQEEVEQKTERAKEEEAEEEEGKVKEGAEEGSTAEELGQAIVVVPAPPNTDEPSVSAVEDSEVPAPSLKRSATNPPDESSSDQPTQEQQCDTSEEGGADPATVAAISLSKTPIMRMKTKSEPKRIAVSLKSADEAVEGFGAGGEGEVGGEQEPIEAPLGPMTPVEMLLHDSMKLGGSGLLVSPSSEQQRKSSSINPTVLPAGLAQVLSAFQAQQSAAAAQPQLLIPLSSIPSYSAAMDTNALLGNTYKKFPYPSMAEISSLAAQTQFTEEQIKVWFSAQRLKHGVSWTPEEVEEARRKQFNGTVHTVPQTITVIPAHQLSAAANGLQSILQTCQIVGQPGLVFTQVGPGGHLPVTSPITLTVAGLPSQSQSSSRVSCQPTPTNSELKRATTVQPPSLSPQNSALSADTFSLRPKKSKEQLAELKASYLKNHFVTDAEIARLMKLTNLTKGEIKKWFSDTRYNQRNSKNSHVIVFHDGGRGGGSCGSSTSTAIVIDSSDETPTSPHPPRTPPVKEKETRPKTWNPFPDFTLQKFKEKTPEQLVVLEESFEKSSTPSDEELSRLRTETKLTRREIDAWFTERRKMPPASTCSPDSSEGGKIEAEGAKAGEGGAGASSSSPTASSSRKGSLTPPGSRSKQLPGSSNKDMKDKSKKTPEQLHILKSAFVRTQWPTPEEYDQLSEESGLPRSYIVSWFGDSRYSWKNSNLKWFFQYQSGNVEGPNGGGSNKMGGTGRKRRGRSRGWGRSRTRKQPRRSASSSADLDRAPLPRKSKSGREILKEYYLKYRFLNEQDLDELVTKTNMSYEQVREWFAEVQRRLDMGLDPFQEAAAGRTDGDGEGGETQGEASAATEEQGGAGAGDEDEDDDEGEEEDDGDDTDDSEVWEPSRSVRKSLSVSED